MVLGANQRREAFNIIPNYRRTTPLRRGAERPKGTTIIVIMLLAEAKAVGWWGNMRNLAIARGCVYACLSLGRYKARQVSLA